MSNKIVESPISVDAAHDLFPTTFRRYIFIWIVLRHVREMARILLLFTSFFFTVVLHKVLQARVECNTFF